MFMEMVRYIYDTDISCRNADVQHVLAKKTIEDRERGSNACAAMVKRKDLS